MLNVLISLTPEERYDWQAAFSCLGHCEVNNDWRCKCGNPVYLYGNGPAFLSRQCGFPPPPPPYPEAECILCKEYDDKDKKCFSCKFCKADREYLDQDGFTLVGYDGRGEVWTCDTCHQHMTFELMNRTLTRDVIHVKMRKLHLKYHCRYFASGEWS